MLRPELLPKILPELRALRRILRILPRSRQRRSPSLRLRKLLRHLRPRKTILTSVPITYTSEEQIEVYRFSLPVTVGVPLLALFLQAFLPRHFPGLAVYLDLPLLVTIYFAMARRNPISGLLTGSF